MPQERSITINFRPQGHHTEQLGAAAVASRRIPQRLRLLETYEHAVMGRTDEEAARACSLTQACYWKRCGELRDLGYIKTLVIDGHEVTRMGEAGVQRIVCWITEEGEDALLSHRAKE